ncbi:hypothetical protein [Trebonia kvetii]|uniref:hypothetical protein n=1 Tax=Trebonia kvetii TaxID=2480626 RepID=UPI00165214DD|nr:hypothetical protein [Trebonia kvetii]
MTVWGILVACAAALGFIGFWFSLRSLRWFAGVTAFVVAIAITRFGLTHPEYTSANLVDSFLSGVDRVVIALIYPIWRGLPPAPGVAGRWIIAVGLLLGYRELERWTLRWQAPELDLSGIGRDGPTSASADSAGSGGSQAALNGHGAAADGLSAAQRRDQLAAELRFRLPTMEIRSPSILPGGTRANALASIAESSGVSGAGMVGAVFRFAGMFWPSPRLVGVRGWVESASAKRITVLLEDVKTGLPIATNTVAGDSFNETASMVAGYIARQIFAMDRTVPEWCYGVSDGRDLGAMQIARLQRAYAACPRDVADSRSEQIKILSASTGTVRTAGIIRYELAQLLVLQRQHLESLHLHALNRELHRRLYRGRYRFAMALEMIANPEHRLPDGEASWDKLGQTLEIVRCGMADGRLAVSTEYQRADGSWSAATRQDCATQSVRLSRDLAMKLLAIAARDLREVRTQLDTWHVVRDAILRRDERAVWLPHWSQRHRRAFHDGVCVAELLVAIRCRLAESDDEDATWLRQARVRWHLRRATGITACIAGDPAIIDAVLADPHGEWWAATASTGGSKYRRRTSDSWQAAYNTACVYAALADAARAGGAPVGVLRDLEGRVIASLRRVVGNPRSELERPSDWIDSDPDFRAMQDGRDIFGAFQEFLIGQMRQDYPVAFMSGECPVSHIPPEAPALPATTALGGSRRPSRRVRGTRVPSRG